MSELVVADAGGRHAARLDRLVELEQQIAALHAEQYRLLARIEADPPTTSLPGLVDKHWAVEDVACALRLSPALARARLAEATEMARLPHALQLLSRGAISAAHTRALTEATFGLDHATVAAIETRVLSRAPAQSVGAFRTALRRAVLIEAAPTLQQRRQANLAERRVCTRPGGEGTTELWALLPDDGAAALMTAITALAERRERDEPRTADQHGADQRTADQRRADALVQLGLDALAGQISQVLPRQQRLRPAVQVTIALSTLLELDNQPGELSGIGPISAAAARHLAADPSGTWRRLITDPHGRLLDYGRTIYRPPPDLTRHVMARDRTCRFPNCTRTAHRSELDHTQPWADGGPTNPENLTTLCLRHHHLRHDTRWSYTRNTTTNTTTWTTPTGHTHTSTAPPYPTTTDPTDTSYPTTTDPEPATAHPLNGTTANNRIDDPDPPPF